MNNLKSCFSLASSGAGTGQSMSEKTKAFLIILTISFAIFQSCAPSAENKMYMEEHAFIADSVEVLSASDTINGVAHNFIRTASLKCRVKNVFDCSQKIERLVSLQGGYISKSELSSQVNSKNSTRFKKDSLLEVSRYTVTNMISLRIPTRSMDTILGKISGMALFMDLRRLTADDVKLNFLANQLAENRFRNYKKEFRNNTNIKAAKLNHVLQAEENILEKQAMADNKRIESLELSDLVNFCTINVELYQPQEISKLAIADPEETIPYTPSFFNRLDSAFTNGFNVLENCVLFVVNSWGLILCALILWMILIKNKHHFVKRTGTV